MQVISDDKTVRNDTVQAVQDLKVFWLPISSNTG